MEELKGNWSDGLEDDELVRELLDNDSPFFLLPEIIEDEAITLSPEPTMSSELLTNRLASKVYSGPTINDIESALSITKPNKESGDWSISRAGISILEKGLGKLDHKYTLKIKSCENGMANDGYKWRKYGQKSIKNSPNPRSYYRCTNPRCSAKKQVERSVEDPDTLIITYEGLHLHFAYSHFLLSQLHHANSPIKKSKKSSSEVQAQDEQESQAQESPAVGPTPTHLSPVIVGPQQEPLKGMGPQGLLEDVVPLMIRNPYLSNSSCSSSYSYSPPTSSSSLSWSPN